MSSSTSLAQSLKVQAIKVQPLKIALLGYRSDPHVGGQGIYLRYLSRALTALGHTVHVYSGQPYPELDENIELYKVPSLDLFNSPNHVYALRFKHLLSYSDFSEWWTMLTGGFGEPYTFGRRIKKRLKNSDYDIIHDNQSLSYGLLALQKAGHTIVSTIHHPIHRDRALALNSAKSKGHRALIERWHDSFLNMQEKVVSTLNNVITVSEQSQKDIAHFFKRNTERTPVFFNGIDTELFRPLATTRETNVNILTTSSSDQPLKGLHILLEAFNQIQFSHPELKLNIIGSLKENSPNREFIDKHSLNDRIVFHSRISDLELVEKYNQASIVVCPSMYEGFGLPAAEALACGRPVISSDGGALPEVIGDTGIIVPAGNAQALAEAISTLLADKEKCKTLSTQARQRALDYFSWGNVANQLSHYYQGLLTEKNKKANY